MESEFSYFVHDELFAKFSFLTNKIITITNNVTDSIKPAIKILFIFNNRKYKYFNKKN